MFIGDYIDRGPDSRAVVDLMLQFSKEHPSVMLRGNHEQMMLDAQQNGDVQLWVMNGGNTTLKSYGAIYNKLELPSQHFHFYRNTYLYYNTPDYFFVHAGLPPDVTVEEAIENEEFDDTFLWTRSHIRSSNTAWEKTVVFGHTPISDPVYDPPKIAIDTGCVFGNLPGMGTLTAVLLPEGEFIQQQCIDSTARI